MELKEIRTLTITEKGQIVIPKSLRKLKGFSTGSKIALLTFKDRLELRPLNQISKKIELAVASEKTLSKDWNSKEDEQAWKNL